MADAWLDHRFPWPDGVTSAVCLTFDLDAETMWTSRDPTNADRPVVMSQAVYEIRIGIPLVLEFLRRNGIRSTFFTPGWVAEQHPKVIAQMAERGHEVANHGWGHLYLFGTSKAEEEDLLVRTSDVLERICGIWPVGYRAPYFDLTPNTLGLLRKHGFRYSANMMDSVWPYLHEAGEGEEVLAEVPGHWGLDDGPHFLFSTNPPNYRQIFPPAAVLSSWRAEFDGIRRLGGLMTLILHPQLIARPSRLEMLQQLVDFMRSQDGVWITTAGEVAQVARSALSTSP